LTDRYRPRRRSDGLRRRFLVRHWIDRDEPGEQVGRQQLGEGLGAEGRVQELVGAVGKDGDAEFRGFGFGGESEHGSANQQAALLPQAAY
jgi:hypothetical protein